MTKTDEASVLKQLESVRFGEWIIHPASRSPYPILQTTNINKLYVCSRCFEYMTSRTTYKEHITDCPHPIPPGKKVYDGHGQRIYKVDGSFFKSFCQNLSLFGKLFIDNKTVYFDLESFDYFVLTDNDQPEKHNVDQYNLACIVTFPPFQNKSYGRLLIECSYALSHLDGYYGTPERPLSDLGMRSYVSFWMDILRRSLPDQKTEWTLSQWSQKTGLKEEDITLALKQSKLLDHRVTIKTIDENRTVFVISPDDDALTKPLKSFKLDLDCLLPDE
ncbi:acyl-CoA N-acyltransferase [Wallemia mellicola]|nr:acyl-CoA N-acyltransferase [Wallemia mellicola]TIC18319.1 acyl-CoA N-acyltransferase [Wallemia mellicola]TIC50925.1 acyl-CoA N-acyltransferase [Wallemia mellicola]